MKDNLRTLEGKRVVVIGGTSGIGFAVAKRASDLGATVVVGSSYEAKVAAAVERLDAATGARVDLRDETNVASFFNGIGAFDHLVLTAGDWGGRRFASALEIDLTEARDFFEVRFWGVLAAVKQGCRTIAEDGSITLTSGILSRRPRKGTSMQTALTGAVEQLTRALALDISPVRVNAVSPGIVLTEHMMQLPETVRQSLVSPLPIPRGASPAEAALAYIYLIQNNYATGQVIAVDGGALLL
jgi:NAD(P)-dependent dehydrogenase (short-subunit alcohol dehydrogenase family)